MSSPPGPVRRPAPAGRPARPRAARSCSGGRPTRSSPGRWRARPDKPQWVFYEGPPTANGRPGHAPHRGAGVQGRLPPVQDHAGLARAPPRRLGLPRPAGGDRRRAGARASPASPTSSGTASPSSTPAAGSPSSGTSTPSPSSPAGWATGSTCPPPTGRWTRATSRASGGRSSRSSTRACWSRTTGSPPTARAAAPGLSDHEVAQGYETLTDPSVYVRLPVTSGEWAGKADLLIWTTTPWTLPSNTAVAVHPDVTYVVARRAGTDDGTVRRRRAAA